MTAKIIVVANQKGGAGKTTVTMQLAGTVGTKRKTLVVDADPQGTATRWAASAPEEAPFPAGVIGLGLAGGKVHQEIKKFVHDYDFIFVDCPPAVDSPIPQSALMVADLAIVPVLPSPLDLWAAVGIKNLIQNISDLNGELEARLLINQCQPNTNLTQEVLNILPEFGIPLLKTRLHQRTAYRESPALGGTVHVLGSRAKPAVSELERLAKELLALVK